MSAAENNRDSSSNQESQSKIQGIYYNYVRYFVDKQTTSWTQCKVVSWTSWFLLIYWYLYMYLIIIIDTMKSSAYSVIVSLHLHVLSHAMCGLILTQSTMIQSIKLNKPVYQIQVCQNSSISRTACSFCWQLPTKNMYMHMQKSKTSADISIFVWDSRLVILEKCLLTSLTKIC